MSSAEPCITYGVRTERKGETNKLNEVDDQGAERDSFSYRDVLAQLVTMVMDDEGLLNEDQHTRPRTLWDLLARYGLQVMQGVHLHKPWCVGMVAVPPRS